MQQQFTDHIRAKFPFLKDQKLLIAISGGIDSVVLTHLLHKEGYQIALAHCNFQLRKEESNLDEVFIKDLGKSLNIATYCIRFETTKFAQKQKLSTQLAARSLRYNWFQKLLKEEKFSYVLTAHHADDNLETFLINLTRGTGLEGLTGIPAINNTIIRPLLPFSRTTILAYAKDKNIEWREDKSNASTKYIRNKIRHQVIPILKEINPSLLDSFAKTTTYLQDSQEIITDKIQEVSENVVHSETLNLDKNNCKLNIQKINQLSNPKAYLYQLLKSYHFTEWNDIYKLLSAQSGKYVFSKTHVLLKDREFLILFKKSENSASTEIEILKNQIEITNPIHLKLEECQYQELQYKQSIFIDTNTIQFPLKVRKWKNGDVFYPYGMEGKKKVSKFFKDEKFSLFQKQNTWLLCNNNNAIIWIVGYRKDRRFLATKNTKTALKISFLG